MHDSSAEYKYINMYIFLINPRKVQFVLSMETDNLSVKSKIKLRH